MAIKNQGIKSNEKLFERCFRLLEYLRVNTDRNHTIRQKDLMESEIKEHLGKRETLGKTLALLAMTLNFDDRDVKPKDEWTLVYKAFAEYYGENGDYFKDEDSEMPHHVTGIYFNHVFSDSELTDIINSLRTSKTITNDRAETLIDKIKRRLASKFYKEPLYTLELPEFTDSPLLAENVGIIQRAISKGVKISFIFNFINQFGLPVPTSSERTCVSPHYIVSDKGRVYLIGGYENGEPCVYRIDLMSEIHLSSIGRRPISAKAKSEIKDLPQEMSEEFKVKHLYMSYESPITATFKNTKKNANGEPNYTFVNDYFGSNYTVIDRKENIIRVRCSKWGLVNFAVQFGEYIEVLNDDLREEIAKRVKQLSEKYL
ncbi:MAG: WYL domain-containing protein [Lachnospiraceae bacterium]|nr:WYL domain-containing protein [Ruminococcus sp.]MCM1276595.1 WYL domain-containing protein [Lachnospiraceae bacterium]